MRSFCWSLLFLGLTAGAAEPVRTEPLKIAAPGLTAVGLTAELSGYYAEHLAQKLAFQGLRIVTAREIQALVGHERQRQLLGCTDEQCVADIAGALGADALLLGDVARVGGTLNFNLRILSSRDAERLAAFSARVDGEDAVLTTLDRAAELMAAELSRKLGRPLAVNAGARSQQLATGPRSLAWIPAAGGVAMGAVGATLLVFARDNHLRLQGSQGVLTGSQAADLRNQGATFQGLGFTGLALGAVGLGAAATMYFMGGGQSTVQTGLAITPDGASLTWVGVFP
ncbi:MAG: hypothetical protein M3Y59_16020 [Myxococcota bacterium]|nr:hypothetical protein [Myxococcota bacterium]